MLTVDEVASLLDAIPVSQNRPQSEGMADMPDDPAMLRDKALLEFMYATGCRVSEAVGMNLDDIDIDDAHVARLTGKRIQAATRPARRIRMFARCADTSPRGAARWRAAPRARRNAARYPQQTGTPLSRQSVWEVIKLAGSGPHRSSASPAHAPALFRHAPDPGRRRRAHRAGTARPCLGHHHADIHARQPGDLD